MIFVFSCLFIVDCIIHLYASMKKNRKLRNISKVFILPLLIAIYITSTNTIIFPLLMALILSWFGDLFLILKGHLFFSFGGVSFGLAHICLMITYCPYIHIEEVKVVIICVVTLIYLGYVVYYFKQLIKYIPKYLLVPMIMYLLANASMNCFALALFISNPNLITSLVYIGALLFFISDCNLFRVRFKIEEIQQNHFIVMFAYILAELLIVIGIVNI